VLELYLLIAAFFEVGFTTFMKLGQGNWRSPWQIGFVFSAVLSFVFLEQASRTIPLGIAYAVWTGLGASGTILVGTYFFGERLGLIQTLLLCNLLFSVVALKLFASSGH
jgi:quaternary ammonium compound-resistance protein SugE